MPKVVFECSADRAGYRRDCGRWTQLAAHPYRVLGNRDLGGRAFLGKDVVDVRVED